MLYLKSLKIALVGILFPILYSCTEAVPSGDDSAMVHVEKTPDGYQLIRNDEPFFIKGAAGDGSHLLELKEAGGNTIRLYDTLNLKENLDAAHAVGLAVIVDIPLPKYGDGSGFYEGNLDREKEKISRIVSIYKNHPALLYWNLGNELYYPTLHKITPFFDSFNELVSVVQKADPNHPVSTAIIGGNRRRLASVVLKSPELDLISINSFGSLTNLKEKMEPVSPIWEGPYVITEWGVNGPWEVPKTTWGAPFEHTDTQKSADLVNRYKTPVMQDEACLGSVVFFWGNKQERTDTWFSIFSEQGAKGEIYHTLQNLWTGDTNTYSGPRIKEVHLNGKEVKSNIILSTGEAASAEVSLLAPRSDSLQFTWVIRKEAWSDIEQVQPDLPHLIPENTKKKIKFTTPESEGPYRLFVSVTDGNNNQSTANIPFYALNPANGK